MVRSVSSEPVSGGGAVRGVFKQLTLQAGIENFPSISPDGKTFVYVSSSSGNADIYLQRVDGRLAQGRRERVAQLDASGAVDAHGAAHVVVVAVDEQRDRRLDVGEPFDDPAVGVAEAREGQRAQHRVNRRGGGSTSSRRRSRAA